MPIKIENVFHAYSKNTPFQTDAIRNINLEIEDGTFLALVGATGSGKSTLVQHLNALLIPDSGTVRVDDFIITSKKKKNKNVHELRKHLGLVFQFPEYQLFENDVETDVMFGPLNFKVEKNEALKRAHEALSSVGLDESYYKRSPFELSGGEKRRVALAGILAIQPDILVLDEPTAGLDPVGAKSIMTLIKKMHEAGKTIILITHDMDLVLEYADKVVVMNDGQIIKEGKPADVFSSLDESSHIDLPQLYQLINIFKNNGCDLSIKDIKTIDDLVDQLVHIKGER